MMAKKPVFGSTLTLSGLTVYVHFPKGRTPRPPSLLLLVLLVCSINTVQHNIIQLYCQVKNTQGMCYYTEHIHTHTHTSHTHKTNTLTL